MENVYTLAVGLGIIVLCLIAAIIIFRVRSRSLAFDNSLFQNLEEESWVIMIDWLIDIESDIESDIMYCDAC